MVIWGKTSTWLSSNTERLNKLFAATGSSVDDYADVLGSRLVTAIRNGTASSDQLKTAVEKIGKVVTGGKADIMRLTDTLDTVDGGQAAEAVIIVKKNLGDLGDTDLTNLTKQALTLEELYGIDMNETLRGVNSLMKQYGLTAQEAMDYVVRGTQNGLDKTNELGDNLSEYAGKFEQAGYSTSEYFQLLQNGLQGGAYNLDKVNEVTTRLADGTIGDSIDLYSQKTQSLFLAWQNGEATQKQVIDSIVADIRNCTSHAGNGGKYPEAAAGAGSSGEKDRGAANVVLLPLVAIITAVSEVFGMLPEPVQNFVVILGALLVAFTALTPVSAALAVSFGALNISMLPVIGIIAGVAAAIVGIIAIVKNWGAITEWFGNLWQAVSQKLVELWNGPMVFFTETIPAAFQTFISFFLPSRIGEAACGHRYPRFSQIPGTQSCRIPLSSWW